MPNPLQHAGDYGYDRKPDAPSQSAQSAGVVVPLLHGLFRPRSVVDFGCGLGHWLNEFRAAGTEEIAGYDGSWVPRANLAIPAESFRAFDLGREIPVERRFDLAMSLEVAEHVSEESGEGLLRALAAASDVIVFSAAIPGQGGYEHVNERYQQAWVDRFAALGYAAFDLVRPRIWEDRRVNFWYRQNILVYLNAAAQERFGLTPVPVAASLVHPEMYEIVRNPRNYALRKMLPLIPHYLARFFRRGGYDA